MKITTVYKSDRIVVKSEELGNGKLLCTTTYWLDDEGFVEKQITVYADGFVERKITIYADGKIE